ncbi:MAG: leucine-rich repeat domain-containing protein [Spirochaetota bacterium]
MKHTVIFFLAILIGSTCKSPIVKRQKKSSQPSKQTKPEKKTKKTPELLSQSELTYISQLRKLASWNKTGKYKGILSLDKVQVIRLIAIEEENFDLSTLAIFKNLRELHINQSQLSDLPTSLVKLQQLEKLNLADNHFTAIPSWICKLKNLRVLNMARNQLQMFPKYCKLTTLKELDLSDNQLKKLPEFIDKLQILEHLQIRNNFLSLLPTSISKLVNLKTLNVAHNQLAVLPNSIVKLDKLENLNVSHNLLYSLPNQLGSLKNLTTLQGMNNRLSLLPSSIHALQQLTELNVARNHLRSLPNQIGNLNSLKKLYCENNSLTILPPTFTKLKQLEVLRLYDNKNIIYSPELLRNWEAITNASEETTLLFPGETVVDAQYAPKKTSHYILSQLENYKCIRSNKEYDLSGCILRIYHNNKFVRKVEHIYPIRWKNETTLYLGDFYSNQIQKYSLTYNIFHAKHPLLLEKPVYNPDKTYYYKIFNNSKNYIDCRNVYPKYSDVETKTENDDTEVEESEEKEVHAQLKSIQRKPTRRYSIVTWK